MNHHWNERKSSTIPLDEELEDKELNYTQVNEEDLTYRGRHMD